VPERARQPAVESVPVRFASLLLLLPACAAPAAKGEWLPFAEGTRWTYAVRTADEAVTVHMVCEGGDVRTLDGADTRYEFVYGRPEHMGHDATKSIYAMAPDGPREFYFDGFALRLLHDPPLPLLPAGVKAWTWTGTLGLGNDERAAIAHVTVEGPETVTVPAGTFRALRVRAEYDAPVHAITRWYARGVGLVRMEIAGAEPATVELVAHTPATR